MKRINNVIVISDTHSGCKLGLSPPSFKLDEANIILQSPLQAKVWGMWKEFWRDWVPMVTKGEDYVVVHNGDALDGVHHGNVTQVTHNLADQRRMAFDVLSPITKSPKCKGYYHIRGTEAHVGKSGQDEESLAKELGAVPDEHGNHARWELWLRMANNVLGHFTHHIGTTSSAAYESTAPYKEMVEAFVEAGKLGNEPPDFIVRSHRHRSIEIKVPTKNGHGIALVTPAWQLKTPFTYRVTLGRISTPQIGGFLIRSGHEDRIYTRSKIWQIERTKEVKI